MVGGAMNWCAHAKPKEGDAVHVLARQRLTPGRDVVALCGERFMHGFLCMPAELPTNCDECKARNEVDLP